MVLATYITTPDEPATDLATAARNATHHALALLQEWLADERLTHTKLLFVTRGAIAARPGEDVSDLANAPVWGLVRSAQREHPNRLWLVDIDDDNLAAAVTAASDNEPQLALRAGTTLTPRLTHHTTPTPTPAHFGDPDGTILITGGTGTLGALLARHLVTRHGSRHLLLTSRRGEHAPGAHALAEELTTLGANVTIAACDAADRTTLAALLDTLPTQHPLTTVIHAAGTLDDATITNLTPQQLDHVLQPKIDAALNLHHLTHHHNLSAFILFSGAASTFGSAGQAHYAAANVFLDALAAHRTAHNLPATSLGWGFWAERSEMTGHLDEIAMRRIARIGLAEMTSTEGLALFDAAVRADLPFVLPARLDPASLNEQARAGTLPAILRGLVRRPTRRVSPADGVQATGSSTLADRLAVMPEAERADLLLELVRSQVAGVLGHESATAVKPQQAFKELGFDSLAAVELRNRLMRATSLRLSATLAFDYPTPIALSRYLESELLSGEETLTDRLLSDLDGLESALSTLAPDEEARGRVLRRVQRILLKFDDGKASSDGIATVDQFDSASDDELFDFLDNGI
ncbi:hypothetical protein A6A07_41040 [Streptomyces sp. CB03911]|nr:hypothetical protein A6A07_41040 [Streptomyces sp. CB03911]